MINPSNVNLPTNLDFEEAHVDGSVKSTQSAVEATPPPLNAQGDVDASKIEAINQNLQLELQRLQNKYDELKLKSKNLQLNLAGKIVVLEEQLERVNQQKEE